MSLKWAGVPDRCSHGQYEDHCDKCSEYNRGYKAGIKVGAREAYEREKKRREELMEQIEDLKCQVAAWEEA